MERTSIGEEYIPFFFLSVLGLAAALRVVVFSLGILKEKLQRVRERGQAGQDRPVGVINWWETRSEKMRKRQRKRGREEERKKRKGERRKEEEEGARVK